MSASIQSVESRKTIRCLVIQLARLGDTLQSLMALRAAKQLYPNLEIHFLARERFANAAKKVPWIKSVITLPTETLLEPLLNQTKSEDQAKRELAEWLRPTLENPWDFVINWSFSEASSYLTALIPARTKLGYTRNRDLTFLGADGWSHYVQAIVQGSIPQNIHLTDILTTQILTAFQIHLGDPLPEGNSPVSSKSFFNLTLSEREIFQLAADQKRKWISFQLGAGQDEKTWSPKKWAKVAKYIFERHPEWGIFLLGGKEDRAREQEFFLELQSYFNPEQLSLFKKGLISFVGETSFDLWASLMSRSQWLISGDTAAIHLASLLGTRVINISVGPVNYLETGPYGTGHYVVQSSEICSACDPQSKENTHTCSNSVSAESVFGTWSYASNEWAHRRQLEIESYFSQLGWLETLKQVKIYRSKVRSNTEGGGVMYENLLLSPLSLKDWTAIVMGHVARSWYCGWVPKLGQEVNRAVIHPTLLNQLRGLQEASSILGKICAQASRISKTIQERASTLKSQRIMDLDEKADLEDLGKKLLELQTLIERLSKTHAPLLAFSQMLQVQMHHLSGSHLADLGRESAAAYQSLSEGVAIFDAWIQYTIGISKPIAIQNGTSETNQTQEMFQ